MVSYTIIPRDRGYWIQTFNNDGSHRALERFATEDLAVQRLHELQARASTAELQQGLLSPKGRH